MGVDVSFYKLYLLVHLQIPSFALLPSHYVIFKHIKIDNCSLSESGYEYGL